MLTESSVKGFRKTSTYPMTMPGRMSTADIFADRVRLTLDRKRRPDGKRWTQKDLALAIGAMPNTVNSWLNRGVLPPAPTRRLVAQVLGVPVEYLEGDESEPSMVSEPSAQYFAADPVLARRLPPRAYEFVYDCLRKLEGISLPVESIEVAERFMIDAAFNKLNSRDPRERTEDDMLKDLRAAWVFVKDVLGPKAGAL